MVSEVDGESGDVEGKETCHGRCGGKVMELQFMVSAGKEKKEPCHGCCGGKVIQLL